MSPSSPQQPSDNMTFQTMELVQAIDTFHLEDTIFIIHHQGIAFASLPQDLWAMTPRAGLTSRNAVNLTSLSLRQQSEDWTLNRVTFQGCLSLGWLSLRLWHVLVYWSCISHGSRRWVSQWLPTSVTGKSPLPSCRQQPSHYLFTVWGKGFETIPQFF